MLSAALNLGTDGIGAIALRALLCGAVVWGVVRSVDHAPPAITAVVISLPMGIAAGFAAVAAHSDPGFLTEAIARGVQMFVGIIAFTAVAGRWFDRLGLGALLAASCLAWGLGVLPALLLHEPLPLGMGLFVGLAGMGLSHLIFPFEARFPPPAPPTSSRRPAWPVAAQAVALVLVLSVFGRLLGPGLSAALASVPAVLIFVTIAMKRHHNLNAALTYQSARLGIPCLYVYLVAVTLLTPYFGGLMAVGLALIPALALSAATVAVRVRLGTGQPTA